MLSPFAAFAFSMALGILPIAILGADRGVMVFAPAAVARAACMDEVRACAQVTSPYAVFAVPSHEELARLQTCRLLRGRSI